MLLPQHTKNRITKPFISTSFLFSDSQRGVIRGWPTQQSLLFNRMLIQVMNVERRGLQGRRKVRVDWGLGYTVPKNFLTLWSLYQWLSFWFFDLLPALRRIFRDFFKHIFVCWIKIQGHFIIVNYFVNLGMHVFWFCDQNQSFRFSLSERAGKKQERKWLVF